MKLPQLWAIVPVKLLAQTKQRLAPLLSHVEREDFACAMLHDVLSALTRAPSLAGVSVITADARAAAIAHEAGVIVLHDDENAGTTAAVTQAARHLIREGREGMLIVPADVPLIAPADIEAIGEAHGTARSLTLVPAGVDGGTNALACSPPDAIPFCFGSDSLRRHCDAARACGIEPRLLELARIAQDIDRPADVAAFLLQPSQTQTYAYLIANGIAERSPSLLARSAAPKRSRESPPSRRYTVRDNKHSESF